MSARTSWTTTTGVKWTSAEIAARRARVVEGIRAGLNYRQIAEREGVVPTTITNDVAWLREQSVPRDIARAIKATSKCCGCEVHCPRRRTR